MWVELCASTSRELDQKKPFYRMFQKFEDVKLPIYKIKQTYVSKVVNLLKFVLKCTKFEDG